MTSSQSTPPPSPSNSSGAGGAGTSSDGAPGNTAGAGGNGSETPPVSPQGEDDGPVTDPAEPGSMDEPGAGGDGGGDEPAPEPVAPAAGGQPGSEPTVPEPEVPQPLPDYANLREAAAAAGKLIGAAVRENALADDMGYRQILAREFDYVTPEDSAKWGSLEPTEDAYAWAATDTLVGFAADNAQAVKGHALVWHNQMPAWVNESMSADELENALRSHIEVTLDRYRGQMRAWDVVNEAVDTATASGYRESILWEKLGPEYIADAFRWAREADPEVMLLYNDYGIERIGPKSDFTYQLMNDLLAEGVPIDGIGFQSHISIHRYPAEHDLQENLQRFADLGLVVNISEVDALTTLLPGDQAARWHVQRVAFQQIVSACVAVDGCEAITFWGFSDEYSWLNENGEQDPLLFDRMNQPKPAYEGVMHALAGRRAQYGDNVLRNADFSAGSDQWSASDGLLTTGTAEGRDGLAACVSDRGSEAAGLVQAELMDALTLGTPYSFSAVVRAGEASTVEANLLIQVPGEEEVERNIAAIDVEAGAWTSLVGDFGFGVEGTPSAVSLAIGGPVAGVELCVTDVALRQVTAD